MPICQAQARPGPAGGLKTQDQARPTGKPIGPRPWILGSGLGGPIGPGLRWPGLPVAHYSDTRGRIQGWSEKLLACAGREILLKTVVRAIPTYPMSTFLLT